MTTLYDQIARTSGVDRDIVKRVLIAASYSGGPPIPQKFPESDVAVQIAEEAFGAGYNSAAQRAVAFAPTVVREWSAHRHAAWSEFEPSEASRALVGKREMIYRPLTEEQMTAVEMRTVDPETSIENTPVPALTSLLFHVCKRDPGRFEEATRLVGLFIEQARMENAK